MTIDEAIAQEIELYEIAKDRYKTLGLENCKRFAEEHKQYVEWLEELKRLRENANSYNKEDIELNRNAMYNNAIDDFVESVKNLIADSSVIRFKDIDEMAEQLKEGGRMTDQEAIKDISENNL